MNAFVTGAAGFIGSNLVDRLLTAGHTVRGFDNLSTGNVEFLSGALKSGSFEFIKGDLLEPGAVGRNLDGVDIVFHLAANADVKNGPNNPQKDLQQNTIATATLLEAMRISGVNRLVFASTGSVYGEATTIPTPESSSFPTQTSLYGASKLAAEGLITAYSEAFGIRSWIFRFVSILGERYTHGHVVDFHRQLTKHPDELYVLGNGEQRKSYLYVQDCIDAILIGLERATNKINILNLGTDEYCTVNQSIKWISEALGVKPRLSYSGGDRGWVGDNPFIFLDCSSMRKLDWKPRLTIHESICRTIEFLRYNSMNEERREC